MSARWELVAWVPDDWRGPDPPTHTFRLPVQGGWLYVVRNYGVAGTMNTVFVPIPVKP